jgi:hypothetical protein
LSTNDPQALAWVQDQITSLRQTTDTGVNVRWLPAQMETGTANITTSSSSSGNEQNSAWDRGGQGQQNQPQPDDDREQSARQKRANSASRIIAPPSTHFMEVLGAFGRAA